MTIYSTQKEIAEKVGCDRSTVTLKTEEFVGNGKLAGFGKLSKSAAKHFNQSGKAEQIRMVLFLLLCPVSTFEGYILMYWRLKLLTVQQFLDG